MKRFIPTIAITAFLCVGAPAPAAALGSVKPGIKAGVLFPGTIKVEDRDFGTDTSFTVGGFVDVPLAERFLAGLFLDISNVGVEDEDLFRADVGIAFKGAFALSRVPIVLRPSLGLGYGYGDSDALDEPVDLFTVNLSLETVFVREGPVDFLAEFGFTSAPNGGNVDVEVTHGPIFFLKGGVVF